MCPIYKFMRSWWRSIKSQFYKLLEHSKCLRFKMKRVCQNETCLGQLWGWASKAYLDKLNRRAASIIEGRSIRAEELKSILGWPSLQAHRNYLKCVLVYKCLHGIAPSYFQSLDTRTFSMAITPEVVISCALPSQKLLNTKVASE